MNSFVFTYKLDEIETVADKVLTLLDGKIVLFTGDMGAGKTTFIKALLKAMGSNDVVTSPTFSIVNEYHIPQDKVFHFDFYRLESEEEALNFGIEEYLDMPNWLFMEWPDRIASLIPDNAQSIVITNLENNRRSLKLTINNKSLTEIDAMTEPKF